MRTIEIDFDVYKALILRRSSEEVSENDVLRDLLGLPPKKSTGPAAASAGPAPGDWVTRGARFPTGTEFRANYRGQTYLGRVQDGALMINGKSFSSPSAAARHVTRNNVNGWNFWECRLPGQAGWKTIKALRSPSQ